MKNAPETEEEVDGVDHNWIDLDETQEYVEQEMRMLMLVLMRLWRAMEVQHC